jgi:peptidoglycan-associated lipoprotein
MPDRRLRRLLSIGALTAAVLAASPAPSIACSINIFDRVFFRAGSAALTQEVHKPLRSYAAWMKDNPDAVLTIEGHSDDRGDEAMNMLLSARRAIAVRSFLVAEGVRPAQLPIAAYGTIRPVAICDAESCWSQNRRVVLVLHFPPMPEIDYSCPAGSS